MNLKKLIKSRRGVAIELAIGVMFLLMAFTIMLLSTAGLQNRHRNDDYNSFKERIEINNVGEYVSKHSTAFVVGQLKKVEDVTNDGVNDNVPEGYYVLRSEDNKYEIFRGEGEDAELVLTIELGSDNSITSWK